MAHSRSFLANQKARNAIVGAENLLMLNSVFSLVLSLLPCFRNFFEMVRFDFILDSDLKVWLMEVTEFIDNHVVSRQSLIGCNSKKRLTESFQKHGVFHWMSLDYN